MQTQVAISGGNSSWFLLNASPDLRLQIEATAVLRPDHRTRSSPIAGVVLTSADLDQIVGLLSLRELQRFQIYCTPSLQKILREDNSVFGMLNRIPAQVVWNDIEWLRSFPLTSIAGEDSGLCCEPFSLGSRYPVYVGDRPGLAAQDALLGLIVTSSQGKRLAYLPAVPAIDTELMRRLEDVDLVLFDGTFWSDDELIRVQGGGATAREMGHVPVSSEDGSLKKLSGLRRPRKVFIHINNTNPMLNEASAEYRQVRAAGWEIAEDGWRLEL